MSMKTAEMGNTYGMPGSKDPKAKKQKDKFVLDKVGEEPGGVDDTWAKTKQEQPPKLPQSSQLSPHVNVSGKEAPKKIVKKAEHYALPNLGMYPLDSYDQVKIAAAYFDEWQTSFSPVHRREFCSNVSARAEELGIRTSSNIEKYGSQSYAPETHIKAALDGRRNIILDEDHLELLEKLAKKKASLSPDEFCTALGEFDKVAGIDWAYDEHIPDHFFSTFGKTAVAGSTGGDAEKSWVAGNEYISASELKQYSSAGFENMKKTFGEEMAKEFQKDPVGIFDSLPMDQKKVVMRLATDNSPK